MAPFTKARRGRGKRKRKARGVGGIVAHEVNARIHNLCVPAGDVVHFVTFSTISSRVKINLLRSLLDYRYNSLTKEELNLIHEKIDSLRSGLT